MGRTLFFLIVLRVIMLCSPLLGAANPAEEKDFSSAVRSFKDGFLARAETEFAEFTRKYPNSEHQAEAILDQAMARFDLQLKGKRDFSSVVGLLSANMSQAGKWADQYRYWIGEAKFESRDYAGAVQEYDRLIKDFPDSAYVLNAAYGEALARYRLGELPTLIDLLQEPAGAFQRAAQAKPNEEAAIKGFLLLAEALFTEKKYKPAEEVLTGLGNRTLGPEQKWKKEYLLSQLQLANKRPEAALQSMTNLFSLATTAVSRAETWALQGEIFRQLNQVPAGIASYTNNLGESVPVAYQQQALLKVVDLSLVQGNMPKAIHWLDALIAKQPEAALLDIARLTLGELRLKQYYLSLGTPMQTTTNFLTSSNLLYLAKAQFDILINTSPQGQLLGKALFTRGWCYWEQGKMEESLADFKLATEKLPLSEEQAAARFKWADCQFQRKDYAGAIQNYSALVDPYASARALKSTLTGQALYQILLASIELGDQLNATNALHKILTTFAESDLAERGVLLAGQVFKEKKKPVEARAIFEQFQSKFPHSPFIPEARLAIARSYVQEEDWPEAILQYDAWTKEFTNHVALPAVELDRAWVYYRGLNETNALALFTNFVARFPSYPETPFVQNWIAEYYWRHRNFVDAERNFQRVYENTNLPPSELTYRARYKAGAAALGRFGFDDAIADFTGLIKDTTCPTNVAAEAYFALGDALIQRPSLERTNALVRFEEAINAFSAIKNNFPGSRLIPDALGRIAECHLQLGVSDPTRYERAKTNYEEVLSFPNVPGAVRSQAEIGLATVLEKQADLKPVERPQLLREALNHYLNVFYGTNLPDGEQAPEFWVNKAGNEAARLAESLQQWSQAINVLNYLMNRVERFPSLRGALAKKLEKAKASLPRD